MEMARGWRKKTNPNQPTRALPGSHEKLEILAQRAQHGESLFHAQDLAWNEVALVAWLREPSAFRAALLRHLK
jgi:hypothetical protein